MTRLLDELSDTNQFLLTFYGNKLALGFRGTPSFIERSFNLAYNCDITNGRLHWLSRNTQGGTSLAHIVIGPKRDTKGNVTTPEERLVRGLATHFYQELIGTRDVVAVNADVEDEEPRYDEVELERRSRKMAEDFRATRIVSECFMEPPQRTEEQVYGAPMADLMVRRSFAPDSYEA